MGAGGLAKVVLLLVTLIAAPPGGACPLSATVRLAGSPPATTVEASVSDRREAGSTVTPVLVVAPLRLAVRVSESAPAAPVVGSVNGAVSAPALTTTLTGLGMIVEFELDMVTVEPPEGAAILSVTLPVTGLPPTTWAAAIDKRETFTGTIVNDDELVVVP